MARIRILLEDKGSGQVKVTFEPALADMIRGAFNGKQSELSPAQQYAMVMANAVRDASKKLDKYEPKHRDLFLP